ncbi:DUF397 domain-containing protein [Micromonospora sp. WMMD1102]|uniref:DUF397 domain-containing protein n=1 Tax=Micromonospora sp. WMMD1102 TaxID=3016105 RepID=UPI00241508DC|nr:DUF397 domain-containing protein [Micromonospora sp. WMMD1102]MDG4791215.1 DUF397 domain-containing protein [Micromonospora sp. WMMD1102]
MTADRAVMRSSWRRSSRCVTEHHCVEFALSGDGVALRNSQRPAAVLLIGRSVWRELVAGLKNDAFVNRGGLDS